MGRIPLTLVPITYELFGFLSQSLNTVYYVILFQISYTKVKTKQWKEVLYVLKCIFEARSNRLLKNGYTLDKLQKNQRKEIRYWLNGAIKTIWIIDFPLYSQLDNIFNKNKNNSTKVWSGRKEIIYCNLTFLNA